MPPMFGTNLFDRYSLHWVDGQIESVVANISSLLHQTGGEF